MMCFHDLYKVKAIPKVKIEEEGFKKFVNQAFNFHSTEDLEYENIFLEEAFAEDGHKNNDFELIKCISEIVGKENFVVKRHPRLSANRYQNTGININKDIQIPWEVYILNSDFTKKTIFTVSSNACMTPSLVFDISCRVVYLKNILEGQVSRTYKTKEFQNFIKKYILYYGQGKFYQPSSKEEICSVIDRMLYDEQKI